MKKLAIILAVLVTAIALTLLLATAEGEVEYTGTVAEARTKLEGIDGLATAREKQLLLDGLDEYLTTVAPDEAGRDDLLGDIAEKSEAVAEQFLTEYDALDGAKLAERSLTLRRLRAHLKARPLNTASAKYAAITEAIAEAEAELAADTEAARANMVGSTSFEDYLRPVFLANDYESEPTLDFTPENQKGSNGVSAHIGPDRGADGDNGYHSVKMEHNGNPRVTFRFTDASYGIVFDFDFTTMSTMPVNGVRIENGNHTWYVDDTSVTYNPMFLNIYSDGKIAARGKTLLTDAIVPGEWTHFTLIFNAENCVCDVYIDYQLMHSFYTGKAYNGVNLLYDLDQFRIASGANEGGEFNMDNCYIYQGLALRDATYLTDTPDEELFPYYVRTINNFSEKVSVRKIAFDRATEMLSKYYSGGNITSTDPVIIEAVNEYLAIDKVVFNALVSDHHRDVFVSFVNELCSYDRVPATYDRRSELLGEIDAHLLAAGELITVDEDYDLAAEMLNDARALVSAEVLIYDFINSVNTFYNTQGYIYIEEAYFAMRECYLSGLDFALTDDPAFAEFADCCLLYGQASEYLQDCLAIDNSLKFIAYMSVISNYPDRESWEANYDKLKELVSAARELAEGEDFDPYYSNLPELLVQFAPVNEYFWDRLQGERYDYISQRLEDMKTEESFVTAYGICGEIARFIEENGISDEDEDLGALVREYRKYAARIEYNKDDYLSLVWHQTEEFVRLVSLTAGIYDPAELEPIYEQALPLRFAADTAVPGAVEAITAFDSLTAYLNKLKAEAEEFILAVTVLNSAGTLGDRFAALIRCGALAKRLSSNYYGIGEAKAEYRANLNNYISQTGGSNATVDSSLVAVNTLISAGYQINREEASDE